MSYREICVKCKTKRVANKTGVCGECRKFKCKHCGKETRWNNEARTLCGPCFDAYKRNSELERGLL